MDDELRAVIEKDRKELMGDFCRGCGYCMPCPAGIEINNCARMSQMLTFLRMMEKLLFSKPPVQYVLHASNIHTNRELLQKNLKDYKEILAGKEY